MIEGLEPQKKKLPARTITEHGPFCLAQNALFEVLSTSGNEDTTWEGLFRERNMLQDSTKDAG
jgi:hypothetical protein